MRKLLFAVLFALALCLAPIRTDATVGLLQVASPGAACAFTRIDFTTGSLGAASLSRGSSGTYINSSGILSTATTNVARFNYDANYPGGNSAPALTGPYLLVEPASTNLLLQSNAYLTTPWTGFGTRTLTASAWTSPDGTADGWSFEGSSFPGLQQTITNGVGTFITSGWGKSGTANQMGVQSGSFAFISTPQRYSLSSTFTSSETIQLSNNGNNGTGGANLTLFMFGFQVEAVAATGYFATNSSSYIVTTSATASRSADVVTYTQPAGCGHSVLTLDSGTQTVTCAPGTCTIPATTLNRPNLKYIDGTTWLLNRDLDAAVNDNNPVGLGRVV